MKNVSQVSRSPVTVMTRTGYGKVLKISCLILWILLVIGLPPTIRAQGCPTISNDGGSSISGQLKDNSSAAAVADGAVLPRYTVLRLDSIATVAGYCLTCTQYDRTINHIDIWMDASTTWLEGSYMVGYVTGKNSEGTTAYFSVLDTQASNSTGPASSTLMFPGTYHFKFQAALNNGVCSTLPQFTNIQTITVYVGEVGDDPNNGATDCNGSVAKPINVTNGNMYLSQSDYHLPGFGSGLELKRTYNSKLLRDALFGFGWSSILDESIEAYGTTFLRLNWNDGRAVYFSRPTTTGVFTPQPQLGFRGQIVKNGNGTYTLTLKDGSIHQFSSAGKILSLADANSNQIVFTYDGSGKISAITDAVGRVITPTYASNGRVATLSDSVGIFATYTYDWYWSTTSVTYADGSKYNFGYDSQHRLTSVTDALGNILESHTYDGSGRALTSEIAGNGTERYTLNYVSATETEVTDALNHVTKYFFDKI